MSTVMDGIEIYLSEMARNLRDEYRLVMEAAPTRDRSALAGITESAVMIEFKSFATRVNSVFRTAGAESLTEEMLAALYKTAVIGVSYARGRPIINGVEIFEAEKSKLERMAKELA